MATRLERRSTISLPLPSLSASLKSATSITPLRSLASASLAMILFILSPISLSPLSATMSAKLPPLGTSSSAVLLAGVLVGDVLHEQQDEDVVLVLRGIHAAAQFVAAFPEGAVEFGFLDRHKSVVTSLIHTIYCAEEYAFCTANALLKVLDVFMVAIAVANCEDRRVAWYPN